MAMFREVLFHIETLDGNDPIELAFTTAKHDGALWKEAHDRIARQLRDAETADRIYRMELVRD